VSVSFASQAGRRRFESGRPLSGTAPPAVTSVSAGFFAPSARLSAVPGIALSEAPFPRKIHNTARVAYSPVSDDVAIEADLGGGRHALWVVASTGWRARQVVEYSLSTFGGVSWTPDGRTLVYTALIGGRMQLFAVPAAGRKARQFTHDAANVFTPRVSPDGRFVAATRHCASERNLAKAPSRVAGPDRGGRLYYRSCAGGGTALKRHSRTGLARPAACQCAPSGTSGRRPPPLSAPGARHRELRGCRVDPSSGPS
jgi:hypothetical protein